MAVFVKKFPTGYMLLMGLLAFSSASAQQTGFSQNSIEAPTKDRKIIFPPHRGMVHAPHHPHHRTLGIHDAGDSAAVACSGLSLVLPCKNGAWHAEHCDSLTHNFAYQPKIGSMNRGAINRPSCRSGPKMMTAAAAAAAGTAVDCPVSNVDSGSGFASAGAGNFRNSIFWFDWTCGTKVSFTAVDRINKSWKLSDGTIVTGRLDNITDSIGIYNTGDAQTSPINKYYVGINPIGLRTKTRGTAPSFRLTLSAVKDGKPISMAYVIADAETTDKGENLVFATTGSPFTHVESSHADNLVGIGTNRVVKQTPSSHAIIATTGNRVALDVTLGSQRGLQGAAFGVRLFFADIKVTKTSKIFDPDEEKLKALPGNDVIYSITATNVGDTFTDENSLILFDKLPPNLIYYNGDADGPGPMADRVIFSHKGSGLSFDPQKDVAFSDQAAAPISFAQCDYTPAPGYDSKVKHICLHPKGTFLSGKDDPKFTLSFRATIK